MVDAAAALLPAVRRGPGTLAEGPRWELTVGPGIFAVACRDWSKHERTAERARQAHVKDVDAAVAAFVATGEWSADPTPRTAITSWSRKSRAITVRRLCKLDYPPLYKGGRLPAMVTLTYPGDWLTVAPTGQFVKRHMKALRKRYQRAWGEDWSAVWKLESQRRGAPHVHMHPTPPHGHAKTTGLTFAVWLSAAWAAVVNHPDPEQRRRHERAGTALDYAEGLRATDPRRVAAYFTKHGLMASKEYQHHVPPEWSEPGSGPGRFWGVWNPHRAVRTVQVTPEDGISAGRIARRWARAQGRVQTRWVQRVDQATGRIRYRRSRTCDRLMTNGNRGWIAVNQGSTFASSLAGHLTDRTWRVIYTPKRVTQPGWRGTVTPDIGRNFPQRRREDAHQGDRGRLAVILLQFRVRNYKSLRDEVIFSLAGPRLRGALPPKNDWKRHTVRVAGLYGPNGSGKSTLLRAIAFLRDAVYQSATAWAGRKSFPHHPFAFDDDSVALPSEFEIDYIGYDNVRYQYGFSSDERGIETEWLNSFHTSRPRMLFERKRVDGESQLTFGRHLQGENQATSKLVRPTALFLSVAANANHPTLTPIANEIMLSINFAKYGDQDLQARLNYTKTLLESRDGIVEKCAAMLRYADLGISSIRVDEENLSDEARRRLERILHAVNYDESAEASDADANVQQALETVEKQIVLLHSTSGRDAKELDFSDESDGTIAWLSLAVPALDALEHGEVLMVDEIDSSLHPKLTGALIELFKDEEVNLRAAQLIFSSHDTALLENTLGRVLEPSETWFTEKRSDASTDLYSLGEFRLGPKDNVGKRYLEGRFGASPIVGFEQLKSTLIELNE